MHRSRSVTSLKARGNSLTALNACWSPPLDHDCKKKKLSKHALLQQGDKSGKVQRK